MDMKSLLQDMTIEHCVPDGSAAAHYRAVYRKGTADAVILTAWDASPSYVRSQAEKILRDYAQHVIPDLRQVTIAAPAKHKAAPSPPRISMNDVACRKDGTVWLNGTPKTVTAALTRRFDDFTGADRVPANMRATTNDWVYQADKSNSILCRRALENAVSVLAGEENRTFSLQDLYLLLSDRAAAEDILSQQSEQDSDPGRFFRQEYYSHQPGESSVWQACTFLREQLLQLLETGNSD